MSISVRIKSGKSQQRLYLGRYSEAVERRSERGDSAYSPRAPRGEAFGHRLTSFALENMAHLLALGVKIALVVGVRWYHNRHSLSNLDAIAIKPLHLAGIVRH